MKLYIREGNAVLKMGKFGVVSEIVHFIAEKILEVCIEKGKTQYDIRKRDNKLHRYLGCLEQELLLKYESLLRIFLLALLEIRKKFYHF